MNRLVRSAIVNKYKPNIYKKLHDYVSYSCDIWWASVWVQQVVPTTPEWALENWQLLLGLTNVKLTYASVKSALEGKFSSVCVIIVGATTAQIAHTTHVRQTNLSTEWYELKHSSVDMRVMEDADWAGDSALYWQILRMFNIKITQFLSIGWFSNVINTPYSRFNIFDTQH